MRWNLKPGLAALIGLIGITALGGGGVFVLSVLPSSQTIASEPRPAADASSAEYAAPARPSALGRIAAPGRVEPQSEAIELAVGVIGALKAVYVHEGDGIRRGQLLAEVDNAEQQAQVEEAEATLRLKEAELDRLLHGARAEERREAAAELDQAAADLALAKREFARRVPLVESGVASRQALDQARSGLGVATAKHAAKEAALHLINAPPRAEDVAIAQANLALARAALAERRALLAKTQLRSPIDGVVLRRYLRAGEVISIQPPTPILEVGDIARLRVRAEIDEADVARIHLGQRAWVSADAYHGRRFGGTVSHISQRLGRKTVFTDNPAEKIDTKILEALIDLDSDVRLPVGLRVDVIIGSQEVAIK